MSVAADKMNPNTICRHGSCISIPFGEIKSATNNFADENLLTQGTSFQVYKAQLLQSGALVNIVARKPLQMSFWLNELTISQSLNHKNIVSVFKTSTTEPADYDHKEFVIINKHEANGSLNKHLSGSTLTWRQRLHICVGVAQALSYMHYDAAADHSVIHGKIKSSKILLDENWEPKLNGFAVAVRTKKHQFYLTSVYDDDALEHTEGLTHKSDVFSFGALLFEVLFGREAFIPNDDNRSFAQLARSHYEESKLDDLIDPGLREQMNSESLNMFAETAYLCLKGKRSERPYMNRILLRLQKALELQQKHEINTKLIKFPLVDIELATNNFSNKYCIGSGGYGRVYKAELDYFAGISSLEVEGEMSMKRSTVAIRRIYSRVDGYGEQGFFAEIEILSNCKHPNIVSLLGFCEEGSEKLLIYEYASNGSLDDYMGNIDNTTNFTWAQRIQICLDIANGLNYLHRGIDEKKSIIHRNIKSQNILFDDNWVAKITDFGLSESCNARQQGSTILTNNIAGTQMYLDPEYMNTGKLKTKSDIYSFGVVMFEIMCGKLAYDTTYNEEGLPSEARRCFEEGTLEKLVDPRIRKTGENISVVNQDSLDIFAKIAYQCLAIYQSERPTIETVIKELEKALNFQEKNMDPIKFPLSDIDLATNNFSDKYIIGSGGYGIVYIAKLDHFAGIRSLKVEGEMSMKRSTVAIKRIFSRVDGQGEQGFTAELEMLSNCKHPNIISLLGSCHEGPEMLLIYEYASNGSLDGFLENIDDMINLTWAQRIQICLDIANGLNYLHRGIDEKKSIIHRDIKSANILLDGNWVAKIADFGLSKLHNARQQGSTFMTNHIAGTQVYLDPEYIRTRKVNTKSDIYSFGVVMFEIMCGKLAYDRIYNEDLPSEARRCFEEGTLEKLVDPRIRKTGENISVVNQDSLDIFAKIAYQCLAKTQSKRPTMETVIKELEKALNFQKHGKDIRSISLDGIKVGTQNFSDCNCIGEGRFWKLYEGELAQANSRSTAILAKRWDATSLQGHSQFLTEHEVLLKCKHNNIIGVVGYCNEMNEKIIVYEHASKGRLDKHLANPSLTWMKRLNICMDIANGLQYLHTGGGGRHESLIHRDIKSGSILLDGDWSAKISNLELSRNMVVYEGAEHVDDNDCHSDIYSLGVILLEMLCGRLAHVDSKDHSQSLVSLAIEHHSEKGNLDEMIFDGIKEQIGPQSLTIFQSLAFSCIQGNRLEQPSFHGVVELLKRALKFQEDYEIWDRKLPTDYKEIIQASKTPEIYEPTKSKKDLYYMICKGILQDGKVLFSLGSNGERNEMISARKFSYENCSSLKWRTVQESRFQRAAKMLDITKLMIRIKITTQLLSPGVNYGAYIIFKFCDTRKVSSKPMYVDLKYRKGGDNLHSYFATWRKDKWMMIEVCRFFSQKKDTEFEVLLESFSGYYCGSGAVYIEGIEFRVIESVKNEELDEQLLSLNEVNGKKHIMLSAKEVLYDSSNAKHFLLKPSAESRFQEAIELLPQQVFRIYCKIQSEKLSQDTEYSCYLVFKLSEKCRGLHCPVKVRNLLHRNNKETEIIYFRSPSLWNLHGGNSVPVQREDGWMEVKVWKFNSNCQLKNDYIPMNLKLVAYEGTMSGLIICGLELRSM